MVLDLAQPRCYLGVTMPSASKKGNPAATTSLKIPPRMKAAIARVANDEGMTPHGYLIAVIEQALGRSAKRREFVAAALASRAEFERTGEVYPAEAFHQYLDDRAAGKKPPHPKPVKWRK